jgi:N-acetylglucosamine kinase-like BadF-type ATPase
MIKVILGIDGGGTKTHACLVDLKGNILATAANGGANWERIGVHAVQESLNEIIVAVCERASVSREDIVDSTFALAGIDWDEDKELFAPVLSALRLSEKCHLINDSFAALFAGIPQGIGCVSIAGTGGKSAGRSATKSVQTMGMELGEGGGAGQLVGIALDLLAQAHHGVIKKTDLYTQLPLSFGFNSPVDFFTAIARNRLELDESLAPLIFVLANKGDAIAIQALEQVAKQHAIDIQGIVSQLNFGSEQIELIRAGGLHTAGNHIFDRKFEQTLKAAIPAIHTRVLDISPVFGAVLHAAHHYFDTVSPDFITQLMSGAKKVDLK